MKKLDILATDLFNKIRSRYQSVVIGDKNGKVTIDPEKARFFEFDYQNDGKTLGKVTISMDNNAISVIYSEDIIDHEDSLLFQKWIDFLKELRRFARKHALNFDARNIQKSNLKSRDYEFLSRNLNINESLIPYNSKLSYQKIGNARLVIKHFKSLESEQKRNQSINSIFIENTEGERFKFPYKYLTGARAMARHVSEGGNLYDEKGRFIVRLAEEIKKLYTVKRYVKRNDVIAENLSSYIPDIDNRIKDIKSTFKTIQNNKGYSSFFENFVCQELEEVPEDVYSQWTDELTMKKFNEELTGAYPYIYNIIKNKEAKELLPEDFDVEVTENYRSSDQLYNDIAKSLFSLVRYNRGKFRSEKQAKFILSKSVGNVISVTLNPDQYDAANFQFVLDDEGVVEVTKHTRRKKHHGDNVSLYWDRSEESSKKFQKDNQKKIAAHLNFIKDIEESLEHSEQRIQKLKDEIKEINDMYDDTLKSIAHLNNEEANNAVIRSRDGDVNKKIKEIDSEVEMIEKYKGMISDKEKAIERLKNAL